MPDVLIKRGNLDIEPDTHTQREDDVDRHRDKAIYEPRSEARRSPSLVSLEILNSWPPEL